MNTLTKLLALSALAVSGSSFAYDCRAIFEPGFSKEAQKLVGKKFLLVDSDKVVNAEAVPFRIVVREDLDLDPETLTLQLVFNGFTILEARHASEGFQENVAFTTKFLKSLPSCESVYRP
jgi:hypothetical protein